MAHHPVDVHVGTRIRQRRALLGMSQSALAHAVDLTFQQIQKYEVDANRTSANRLFEFANVLDVPPDFFFEGASTAGAVSRKRGRLPKQVDRDFFAERETLELVRAFYKIRNNGVRKQVLELIEALADRSRAFGGSGNSPRRLASQQGMLQPFDRVSLKWVIASSPYRVKQQAADPDGERLITCNPTIGGGFVIKE